MRLVLQSWDWNPDLWLRIHSLTIIAHRLLIITTTQLTTPQQWPVHFPEMINTWQMHPLPQDVTFSETLMITSPPLCRSVPVFSITASSLFASKHLSNVEMYTDCVTSLLPAPGNFYSQCTFRFSQVPVYNMN